MRAELSKARAGVDKAAKAVFSRDPAMRVVGVGRVGDGFGYIAIRNAAAPQAYAEDLIPPPLSIDGIRIAYENAVEEPGLLTAATDPPERWPRRPLACGLEIQNADDPVVPARVGTIGCFVHTKDGRIGLLTNNHVIARDNGGVRGQDRIIQPGSASYAPGQQIGVLHDFVWLNSSPYHIRYGQGEITPNVVDAAVATLHDGVFQDAIYVPERQSMPPRRVGSALPGDVVYKVGRTTGETRGIVKMTNAVVGAIPYRAGACWYHESLLIQSEDDAAFAAAGDSGAAVVLEDGTMVGLVYGGWKGPAGPQTFACPAIAAMHQLSCSLIPFRS